MIVIGSEAFNHRVASRNKKKTNDLDLVGTYEECMRFINDQRKRRELRAFYPINDGKTILAKHTDGGITELEVAWPGSRAAGFLAFAERSKSEFDVGYDRWLWPSMNVLYTLKMSHRYLKDSPHFLKTMRDIQQMRKLGAFITEDMHPYYLKRMAETYSYSHPKLNVSKGSFFDAEATGVVYTYDHDSIHEAVKVLGTPAYTFFKPENSEVLCDKGMFFNSASDIQLYAVLEEAYVLALERSLIPYPNGKTPKEAFDVALMKVCTSITSGWFREFAWEHYDDVQALYSDSYVEQFEAGLKAGTVKQIKEEK